MQRNTSGRYSIHELLRQFGETSLKREANSYTRVRQAHARYYCDFLGELEDALNLGDPAPACCAIELELGNVHLAWAWACRHGLYDDLIKAEYAIFLFREYQNRFQEMEQMYQTAICHLTVLDPSSKRDFMLACVRRSQAWTALRFGQVDRGVQFGLQSWEYFVKSNLPMRTVSGNDPRAPLTVLYTIRGDYQQARRIGEKMLHDHLARNDGVKAILAYYTLSALELAEGNYEQVRRYGQSAYAAFKATGHRYLWSYLLNNWGNAERALGNYAEAKRLFWASHDHMRDLGSTEGMSTALNNIAYIALLQGKDEESQSIFERNIVTYRNLGDVGGITTTLEGLGRIALHQKNYAGAAQCFHEALQTAGSSLPDITLSILIGVSQLFLATDRREQALPILVLVMHHPASKQEVKDRAQRQIDRHALDLGSDHESMALAVLVDAALQYLLH